jgi:uncharacterized protein
MTSPFAALAAARYVLLTTFRRDGTPVPTPVWVVELDGELWVWSAPDAGKVKRLRRNPSALLVPCSVRGEPYGGPVAATGRVVPEEDAGRVQAALVAKYGWQARTTFLPGMLARLVRRPRAVGAVALRLT